MHARVFVPRHSLHSTVISTVSCRNTYGKKSFLCWFGVIRLTWNKLCLSSRIETMYEVCLLLLWQFFIDALDEDYKTKRNTCRYNLRVYWIPLLLSYVFFCNFFSMGLLIDLERMNSHPPKIGVPIHVGFVMGGGGWKSKCTGTERASSPLIQSKSFCSLGDMFFKREISKT